MAGRTPTVLMAREPFFRTGEISRNHKLEKKQALELCRETLAALTKVWTIEAGNTTVTVGDTLAITKGTTVQSSSAQTLSEPEAAAARPGRRGAKPRAIPRRRRN